MQYKVVKIDFTNDFNTPCGVTSYSRPSSTNTRAAAIYASASYSGERSAIRGVLAAVTGGGATGRPARTALLLPGRAQSADIAAVADCRLLSGRHVDGGRGRHGGGGLHFGLNRAQRSSVSHSTDPSVRSPGSSMRLARFWLRVRGDVEGSSSGGPGFSQGSPVLRGKRDRLPCWHPSGMIWRHLASRLPLKPAHDSLSFLAAQSRVYTAACLHVEDGATCTGQ